MKNICLALLAIISHSLSAQETTETTSKSIFDRKHEVKIGAVKVLAGGILEGTYEYIHSKNFTYGASLLVNFDQGNGYPEDFSITPFGRFYFQESKEYGAKGFFVEGFAKYLIGREEYTYTSYNGYYYNDYINNSKKYNTASIGLSLGKKWINSSGFVFEILIGGGRNIGSNAVDIPASFRGDLNIGYRF